MKLLIWNRGEIAVRACLAAARLGMSSVLFLPPVDEDGPAVRLADDVYPWPHDHPARGFLSLDAVGRVVRATGADLVYPGYGFLAESAGFAAAVSAAGARLVGPSPEVLAQVSHKGRARELARGLGLEHLGLETADHFPVLLKAVAGGGGRGNLLVDSAGELEAARAALARRAAELFGDGGVVLERWLPRARHVELQLFGCTGGVRALGTRDCSLQIRKQKLVEEGPAPTAAQARLAPHVEAIERGLHGLGYRGAGTVELLWDPVEDRLFFLEINPRIQVEHPVTELLIGEDLVEWQLREAAGERLFDRPLQPRGHAIEARLNAEEAGTIHRMSLPAPPFCRWDLGVEEGGRVPPHYDPLLGKLVVWAPDRAQAIARARVALGAASVHGVATNLDLLSALLADQSFARDEHDTRFVERDFLPRFAPAPPPEVSGIPVAPAGESAARGWKRGHRR